MIPRDFDSKFVKILIVWYGIYQAIHMIVNIIAIPVLIQKGETFPALPPPGGWSPQVIYFFTIIAIIDLINTFLTLIFVYGYFKKKSWRLWLGTLTLTISMYAAIIFNFGTISSGAWVGENLFPYLFINIFFIPVVILFILLSIWGIYSQHSIV